MRQVQLNQMNIEKEVQKMTQPLKKLSQKKSNDESSFKLSFDDVPFHMCETQSSSLDLTHENLSKLPLATMESEQGPASIKSGSTMRSSEKNYNTSCDVSSVCEYDSILNDESDNEHLHHNPDDIL